VKQERVRLPHQRSLYACDAFLFVFRFVAPWHTTQ
jgi:hypothetical protein